MMEAALQMMGRKRSGSEWTVLWAGHWVGLGVESIHRNKNLLHSRIAIVGKRLLEQRHNWEQVLRLILLTQPTALPHASREGSKIYVGTGAMAVDLLTIREVLSL